MSISLGFDDGYVLIPPPARNPGRNGRGSNLGEKAEQINQLLAAGPDRLFDHITSQDHDCRLYDAVDHFKNENLDLNTRCIKNISKVLSEKDWLLQECRSILPLKGKDDMPDLAVLNHVVKALYTQDSSVYELLMRAINHELKVNLVSLPLLDRQCKEVQKRISGNQFLRLDDEIKFDPPSARQMITEMVSTMQDELEFLRHEPLSLETWENAWHNLHTQACLCRSYLDERGEDVIGLEALAKAKVLRKSLRKLGCKKFNGEKSLSYPEPINKLRIAIKYGANQLISKFLTELYNELRNDFLGERPLPEEVLLKKAQSGLDLLTDDVKKSLKDDLDFPFYAESLEILKGMIETANRKKATLETEKTFLPQLERSNQLG